MESVTRNSILESAQTCVIKVGSRVLTGPDGRLDQDQVGKLAFQLTQLTEQGHQVVLVSSGAVASGVGKLGLASRPTDLALLQAVAAVGQAHLIQTYERFFSDRGKHAGQVLLIADDLDDRIRYLNVRNTLLSLLRLGVIPIINENDTVAVDELMTTFGDNDRLAAMVAGLLPRPVLVILSDVQGLYDRDPTVEGAAVIPTVEQIDQSILNLVIDRRTGLSKGGMASKLRAAQFVTSSGAPVIIAGGRSENVLLRIFNGETVGTMFLPQSRGLAPRKRWIGFSAQAAGKIEIDQGAARAIVHEGRSLLAIGIVDVMGQFEKGDVVAIVTSEGDEVARGLVNYTSAEVRQIRGCRSPRIAEILGQRPYEEVVHRDNMAIVGIKANQS